MNQPDHPTRFLAKKTILLLLAACLLFSVSSASAGTLIGGDDPHANIDYSNLAERVRTVHIFRFIVQDYGLQYGRCPLYTAPFDNALRLYNGGATCDTDYPMSVCGYDQTGWLMVRCKSDENITRVGYIPPDCVAGYRARITSIPFDYIPVTANAAIYVTDNPEADNSAFAVLDPGESFLILGRYNYVGTWWYVECTVNNMPARGFISVENSSFRAGDTDFGPVVNLSSKDNSKDNADDPSGESGVSGDTAEPEGKIGTVTVQGPSKGRDPRIVRSVPGTDGEIVARVYHGEQYPCYGVADGSGGKKWYKIYINQSWGWISSGVSVLAYD